MGKELLSFEEIQAKKPKWDFPVKKSWRPEPEECDYHEFDWDEGYTCLNCGKSGDIGALIDREMDRRRDGE